MDIDFYVRRFESTMQSYAGDDPLSAWERFVEFLEPRLPYGQKDKVCVVLDKLVAAFLPDGKYNNDLRFINFCITYASSHADPLKVYSDIHTHGVGKNMAALYISWAQQCERRNLNEEAELVYQKAFSNRAEPLDTLQYHYRMFQSKQAQSQTPSVNTPLQDSQCVNQQLRQRDRTQPVCKDVMNSQCAADRYSYIISRSENNPHPSSRKQTECVSMYCVNELQTDGSELSFEELRARRYFTKLRQQELQREREEIRRRYEEEEEEVVRMKMLLEELNGKLTEPHLQQVTPGSHPDRCQEDTPNQAEALSVQPVSERSLTHHTLTAHTPVYTHSAEAVCVSREETLTGANCTTLTQAQCTLKSDELLCEEDEKDRNTHMCYGGFTLHVTPNTSLGLNSATPSRTLPSPTVNTREALDLIGNMFQGPALLQDSVFNSTNIGPAVQEDTFEKNCKVTGLAPSSVKAPPTAAFQIYQDENESSVDPQMVFKAKSAALGALTEIPVSTASVTPCWAESLTENTVWGLGHAPMSSFSNHMQELTLSSHLVSTPLHPVTPYCRDAQLSQVVSGAKENPYLRPPAKLSPILEQSPPEEQQCGGVECSPRAQGTIVGECLSVQRHAHSLAHKSTSASRPALAPLRMLAPLTFPDQSLTPSEELRARTKPSWNVYQSPEQDMTTCGDSAVGVCNTNTNTQLDMMTEYTAEQTNGFVPGGTCHQFGRSSVEPLETFEEMKTDVEETDVLLPERSFNMCRPAAVLAENSHILQWNSFLVPQSPDPPPRTSQDQLMGPEPVQDFSCLQVDSPVQTAESEQGVTASLTDRILLSNTHASERHTRFSSSSAAETWGRGCPARRSDPVQDVPMSPAAEPGPSWNDVMTSPQHNQNTCSTDDPMSSVQTECVAHTTSVLIPDPWDEQLITSLLAGLHTPLSSYTNLSTWSCCVPAIAPKHTVQLGNECLRVDRVVGQGAFATVYQATDLNNSRKLILKVQKPPNPWEFYISTQLAQRVSPVARCLYTHTHTAHLYTNGSVLTGELYNYGTLLNVVNLYKSRSEKVMPQPLVLYLTVCILDIVERLHAARIIHADIKPDNFLLGERFMENKIPTEENVEHGLVLIDFGQSIDMTLFPDGAQFTAHCMTSGFQCTEMLSARPWTYQTDYFGVAGTVYCMLFGSYMQVREDGGVWKSGGVFKRNPHSDLWQEFFSVLLNVRDCASLPCLRVLRRRLTDALMTNYSTKLLGLKNRLVVQILESRTSCR